MQRLVPQAACFVTPRISTWDQFRSGRFGALADWSTLTERTRMAIFIPADVAPQEIRDCLHEELAQSMGPLDDLYRLPDSVLNDDNFNSILTGFDMLMLRVTYAPELHSGMTREEVAARLPAILERLNPRGGNAGIGPPAGTPREWIDDIEAALGPHAAASRRRQSAEAALAIAEQQGWTDNRRAFSLYVLGRLSIAGRNDQALAAFLQAESLYRARPETRLQAAHVSMQLAAYSLSRGDSATVIRLADQAIPVASEAENAALMAQLMLMKAEALTMDGRRGRGAGGAPRSAGLGPLRLWRRCRGAGPGPRDRRAGAGRCGRWRRNDHRARIRGVRRPAWRLIPPAAATATRSTLHNMPRFTPSPSPCWG